MSSIDALLKIDDDEVLEKESTDVTSCKISDKEEEEESSECCFCC